MTQPNFSLEQANHQADDILDQDRFSHMTIAEHNLPATQYAPGTDIEFTAIGEQDAPNVVLSATPMFTRLTDHFKLRLAAQQKALGNDYRVIGVQGYEPNPMAFDGKHKSALTKGDFSPLSARMLRAAEAAGVTDEQAVLLNGYSLGGDIAIQTAHDVLFNEHRGTMDVQALHASEYARSVRRGRVAMLKAFGDSGKDMLENVLLADVAALDEAWNINREDEKVTKKAVNGRVNSDLIGYVKQSLGLNFALLNGFATDMGTQQLRRVMNDTTLPILVSNQDRSKVLPTSVLESLDTEFADRPDTYFLTESGDHSADDNIRRSAGRMIYFASIAQ